MTNQTDTETLTKGLGFREALALVIGTVIGTGVFLKAAVMTQHVGSFTFVMLAWVGAGLLSLAGALCYAELGSRFPEAGGEYAFLREAFGDFPAFLNGWMRFAIGNPGSIAAYAVGLMTCLRGVFELSALTQTVCSCALIATFSGINCLAVRSAGLFQTFLTILKIAMVIGFTLVLLWPHGPAPTLALTFDGWPGIRAFGSALLASLWAFDGWNGMPMAAAEVRDAQKNVPRALIVGMLTIIAIYLLANLAFFRTLSPDLIMASNSPSHPNALPVATNAALTALGGHAVTVVSILLAFSALVALNGSVLTGARVPYAMAHDRLFFPSLGHVHPRLHTPVSAIIAQSVIAMLIACSGTFDQLTDYVMFASWIFYALSVMALFKLRQRPAAPGTFRVPLYPVLPLVFLAVSLWLVFNTLQTAPYESLAGLFLILGGSPIYFYFAKRRREA